MRDLPPALVALNATVAVERLRSRQSQSESACSSTVVTQVLNPESAPPRSGITITLYRRWLKEMHLLVHHHKMYLFKEELNGRISNML